MTMQAAPARGNWTREGLEEAWLHVEENAGCAGVDGITVERFAHISDSELAQLFRELESASYKPLPLLEMRVEKKPGSEDSRRLLIPAVRDRVAQTAVTRALREPLDQEFLESSFAYRSHRGVDSAIARIVQLRDRGYRMVFRADIEHFFDRVAHARLMAMVEADTATRGYDACIGVWLRAPFWNGERLVQRTEGLPQGSPISPLLANYFLSSFDTAVGASPGLLVRYADDLLVLCQTEKDLDIAGNSARVALEGLGLNMSPAKTERTTFSQGFHFLGAYFIGDNVYQPWKANHRKAKVLFFARPMPRALIDHYLKRHRGRPLRRRDPIRRHHSVVGESNDMAFIYITEQGAIVRKSGDRILVESDGQILLDLPCHKAENVLLFGNVQLTSAAMMELLRHGITTSIFTRHGRLHGSLSAPVGRNVPLRIAQFEAYRDPSVSFELARLIVTGKIRNGIAVLSGLARRHPAHEAESVISGMKQSLESVTQTGQVQALDGVEGSAARTYFSALMRFNRSPLEWPGRMKHPAPDPINALLSLTYTLLMHEILGLAEALGLDPYLGFLHQLDYGRPSLALDLLEAFRHPVADRLVLATLNQGILGPEDFHKAHDEPGVVLQPQALKLYFDQYEKWMLRATSARPCYRETLRAEVALLAKHFRDQTPWVPFDASHANYEED